MEEKKNITKSGQQLEALPIANTLRSQLNWSQYRRLIQIDDPDKREYYEFFIDLVFYNRLLRCHTILEIKTHELTHQDLGQLQMYVNYYDRNEKLSDENPTIGILLCTAKNDTVVRMALPENNKTILTSQYQLYLPTTEQLVKEIEEVKRMARNKDEDFKKLLGEKKEG